MQRVSDDQVAVDCGEGCWVDSHERDLALDLRDARARLAALEPVARAAVALRATDVTEGGILPEGWLGEWVASRAALREGVDALPEALRKELECASSE